MTVISLWGAILKGLGFSVIAYFLFLGLLTVPWFQDQAIYLHSVKLTWFQDLSHILPLGLYHQHEDTLIQEPDGITSDIKQRSAFKLLRDDPTALLVLYFHGAAGTLGSGWRPASYRAMYAGAPDKIHTVAIDYRGFGSSTGAPSEEGLLTDAITVVEWAMHEAGISPSRVVIFGQSMGTAVSIALADYYAALPDPILFSGMVLVAPFADVELLTATYRIAGTIPLLGPLSPFPRLLAFFNTFIQSKWSNKDKLASFVRACERIPGNDRKYHVAIIHAEDDYDIPWSHSDRLFWHAVNASRPQGIGFEDWEEEKEQIKKPLGPTGWVAEHRTEKGIMKEQITKWGLHDMIMSYPAVSLAVLQAFTARNMGIVQPHGE
ncbi:Alpha/Beta hydrolase protein [Dichotomopilus funicola]|uniref:Alpha/Beta hydrolase protein n=1 Tax=Dichotomopilus funicola TaxID=1934379 RepID=A0AAN6UVH0_9PEZI|nr:Alpha/Beta hydrolase protein [Dichotomopilus funicola]